MKIKKDRVDREIEKDIAIKAALDAGRLLRENLGRHSMVEYKGEIDLVTEMDKEAESIVIARLTREFPEYGILAEEREEVETNSPYQWIIDPLDGTTNYAHGYPVFCVSIALRHKEMVLLGVVYDPVHEELFVAERENGATLNERPITVSETDSLSRSLLATGFPYDIRRSKENNLDHFCNFALKAQAIRRAGSAALDLCYVACGRFDGFWELKLKPWDVAAGYLMVEEAGGMVTDLEGRPFDIHAGEIAASNGRIHGEMIEVLKGE